MKKYLLTTLLVSMSVLLLKGQNYFVNEDFNAGTLPAGWTNNIVGGVDPWQFGIDGSQGTTNFSTGIQNIDGTNFVYFDDDAIGSSALGNDVELLTPVFDNSSQTNTFLEFDYNFKAFTGIPDSFKVEVFNGTSWISVLQLGSDDCGHYSSPAECGGGIPHANIDITAYANANCQVKFLYYDGGDWGWYAGFDNVEIYSKYPSDLRTEVIREPMSKCSMSNSEVVEIIVGNIGTSAVTGFDVGFTVNGGPAVIETVNRTLNPGATLIYTFTGTADLSVTQAHEVKAFTNLTGDFSASNDTATKIVNNILSIQPTYTNDFETSNNGWEVDEVNSTNSTWEWGQPNATNINAAASGQNAYVTNLGGFYTNNELSYLQSPCFDFSQSIGDPIMTFSLYYLTRSADDRAWMEYSTDRGLTWRKLDAGPNASNWYNNTNLNVWEGNSQGWLNVETVLNGLQGFPVVNFRMVFNTNVGGYNEGVGFDNFAIRDPQPIDMQMSRLVSPISNSAPICGYRTNERIVVEIENKGATPLGNFDVAYSVNSGTPVVETVNSVIPPNGMLVYEFNTNYDFSVAGTYDFSVWVDATGDGFNANDSITDVDVISNGPASNLSPIRFAEDFNNNNFRAGTVNSNVNDAINSLWSRSSGLTWRIANGSAFTNTSPCEDVTAGFQGNYAYVEASTLSSQSANLLTPCIDLGPARGAQLSFYYYMFGSNIGSLFIDVNDGSGWVNVDRIIGQQQASQCGETWRLREVPLSTYAGRSIRVRFRGTTSGTAGDMAIDNIEIIEPPALDARMVGPIAPTSGCEVSGQSVVEVELSNFGTQQIFPDSMYVCYQVDNQPVVRELYGAIISPDQTIRYEFNQTADLSIVGYTYNIKSWVELNGEMNNDNDTSFQYRVTNHTRPPNYLWDFEDSRDASCDAFLGQVIGDGWTAEAGSYVWHVQSSRCGSGDETTPQANTGPDGDHTLGDGMFLYTGTGPTNTSNRAVLVSPCLDLTNVPAAKLSFWYHRYGSAIGSLSVEVNSSTGWTTILNLNGSQEQTSAYDPWKNAVVDLTNYVGDLVQIRFVGTSGGSIGLDDVFLFEPANQDIGVVAINSPTGDACNLSTNAQVTVEVRNFGLQVIPANTASVVFNNNGDQESIETINQSIPVDGTITYTFNSTVDLDGSGEQVIRAFTQLSGDTIQQNNAITRSVYNRSVEFPYYFQDFERFGIDPDGSAPYNGDDLLGWVRNPNGGGQSWHVWTGESPLILGDPMQNPPIPENGPSGDHTYATDRQNGDGKYLILETNYNRTSPPPPSTIKTPCNGIDFTQSVYDKIYMSFWYHMFGANTGDLYVDVWNGTQWVRGIAVINGQQQGAATDPWRFHSLTLDQFANVSDAEIRFRADFPPGLTTGGGDMGIDDVTILDRDSFDLSVVELLNPASDCNLRNQERVEVRIQNTGFEDVIKINMGYQVTFYPLNGAPVVSPIYRDSLIGNLMLPLSYYSFEFDDPNTLLDASEFGRYEIKTWVEHPQDEYHFNDTLVEVIENVTQPFPSCVDFSNLLYGQKPHQFEEELMPNNWTGSPGTSYSWEAALRGPGGTGSDFAGHTTGINDIYMYIPTGMNRGADVAWIQSTCFDLTNTRAANLEFWYKASGSEYFVELEARSNQGAWQVIDTLQGLGQRTIPTWTKAQFVLADFLGTFVDFRLTSTFFDSDFAIDDFCVVPPPPQQIELEEIIEPFDGLCYYTDEEEVIFRVQNVGIDRIDSFGVIVALDSGTIKFPRGELYYDTIWIYPTSPTLEPGDKLNIRYPETLNLSYYTQYYLTVKLILPGDNDTTNNAIYNLPISQADPLPIPYFVDFEGPGDLYEGLEGIDGPLDMATGEQYTQDIVSTYGMEYDNRTGARFDHTLQNNNGHYWTSLSASGLTGDAVQLVTQCIDFRNVQYPELSYWYHRHSQYPAMGNFYVEADTSNRVWHRIDSLVGHDPDQDRHTSPWKKVVVDLSAYAGKVARFRFVSIMPSGNARGFANHGLDDINFYNQPPSDLAVDHLARPTSFIYSCYTDTQTVKVAVRNNGSDSLDFSVDTLNITVDITKDGQPWGTLTREVSSLVWSPYNDPTLYKLPTDSIAEIELDGDFDMSEIGASFDFDITIDMQNDNVNVNDVFNETVLAQRRVGSIGPMQPNDTVCYGTPVALKLNNFFGELQWQEYISNRWLQGSYPAFDSSYLAIGLDSTTDIRVMVCGVEYTDTVTVEVTKPFSGKGLHNSICYSEYAQSNQIALGVEVPSNIDEVKFFSDADTLQPLLSITTPDSVLSNGNKVFGLQHSFNVNPNAYNNDTLYVRTRADSCWSFNVSEVYAAVNPMPPSTIVGVPPSGELCQDTSIRLNAGGFPDRKYSYEWTITKPGGITETDSTQTVVVDAWRLEKDETYRYSVIVTTDSGCVLPNPLTAEITIVDSCVTNIEEYKFGDEFSIYPNPTSNNIFIEYRSLSQLNGTVKLLSMEGKEVYQENNVDFNRSRVEFDLGTLPKGIYFIRIETEKGNIVKKIIKS